MYSTSQKGRIEKPVFGARLDLAHPLSNGLVCDFSFLDRSGERTRDAKNDYIASLTGGTPSNVCVRHPLGVNFLASTTGFLLEGADAIGSPSGISKVPIDVFIGPITLIWRGLVRTGSSFRHFAGYHLTSGATACVFDFRTDNSATPKLVLARANTATRSHTSNAITLNKVQTYAVVCYSSDISVAPDFYIDGVLQSAPTSSGTGTGAVTSSSTANLRLGRRADNAVQMDGIVEFFRAYKRPLTKDEIRWITQEPYAAYKAVNFRKYHVFEGALSVNVASSHEMADGIAVINSPGSIQIAINSLNANNFDAATLGLGLIFSDDANNLSDGRQVALGTALAYDSMFYGLADAVSTLTNGVLLATATDTLTLSDAASVVLFSSQSPGDSFSLSDSVALRFNYNPVFSDTLSLSDGASIILGLRASASDSINNLSDAVVTAFTVGQTVSANDTMNNASDAASTLFNTTLTNYLRRYLNDVVN